jgi:hypothetical protein
MKLLRPTKKWILPVIGLVLAFLVLKVILFLMAKPKVAVDYVAEYNRISRPQNYDPNQNAAEDYQKAYDAFIKMPDNLKWPLRNWPRDFNEADQNILRQWVVSNRQAIDYFRQASHKPYYWLERISERDNTVAGITLPELDLLRGLIRVALWSAKIKALEGQSLSAFENVLTCYKAAQHKCCPNLLIMEQYNGLDIKKEATHSALVILNSVNVDSEALKFLQDALQAELDNDTYVPSIQAEKLFLYDALQRMFIDNGKGTGRLAWRAGWYNSLCSELDKSPFQRQYEELKQRLYCCFVGPTRNELVKQIEHVTSISDQVMGKTPWQIKNDERDYFKEIQNINSSNFFLEIFGISPESFFHLHYKTRAQTEALIAVLATLRYKIDTGRFPESLESLVSAGYLQELPNDPYSDGPLTYKLTRDNFTLYSVGDDFTDDGGVIEITETATGWPGLIRTVPRIHSPDIVYWPVIDINNQTEMLKAEKEAEKQR